MSLNNISLSPRLLADLYQNSLVEDITAVAPQKQTVSFLGNNKKNILILVNNKAVPFLSDKDLAFLLTVLSACGLGLADVAIVNWQSTEERTPTPVHQFNPVHVLFLDVLPDGLGFPAAPPYTVQQTGSVQFVCAPALAQIEKTKQAKSQLWIALKQLFCL